MALLYNGIWEELARENARSMRARELRTGGEWCGLVGVACDLCRDRWMLLLRYHAASHCVSGSGFVRETSCSLLGGALLVLCWRSKKKKKKKKKMERLPFAELSCGVGVGTSSSEERREQGIAVKTRDSSGESWPARQAWSGQIRSGSGSGTQIHSREVRHCFVTLPRRVTDGM
ncbi:hypothetical protein GQ607_007359 [Colletotrichum asianum]|uniref:Uncharacterized protein n=1 Tax=Colletotrichum asianum TaxID=702518 RepID=A0A8H3WFG5_9PEZI|nr:hypothetical protein GQ607_007359 [Colletotrichum asianum]